MTKDEARRALKLTIDKYSGKDVKIQWSSGHLNDIFYSRCTMYDTLYPEKDIVVVYLTHNREGIPKVYAVTLAITWENEDPVSTISSEKLSDYRKQLNNIQPYLLKTTEIF